MLARKVMHETDCVNRVSGFWPDSYQEIAGDSRKIHRNLRFYRYELRLGRTLEVRSGCGCGRVSGASHEQLAMTICWSDSQRDRKPYLASESSSLL